MGDKDKEMDGRWEENMKEWRTTEIMAEESWGEK